MKSVMISIKPYYVYLIIGKAMGLDVPLVKNIEVRKNYPISPNWNRQVLVYCTKDRKSLLKIPAEHRKSILPFLGKVCAQWHSRCICEIFSHDDGFGVNQYTYVYEKAVEAGLSFLEMKNYLGEKGGYGWVISGLKIYGTPKKLSEFECAEYDYGRIHLPPGEISRPPQSWMYVKG